MPTKLLTAALAAALLCANGAMAGDHLYPDDSAMTSNPDITSLTTTYDHLIVTVLKEGFAPDVSARVFTGGSTVVAETLIGVRGKPGKERLFGIAPNENLFAYAELESEKLSSHPDEGFISSLQKELPLSPSQITLDRCEVPVDGSLASDINVIWTTMLRTTRYDTDKERETQFKVTTVSAVEGVQRFASSGFAGQARGAWNFTKNTYDDSDVGQLSRLASAMERACFGKGKGLADMKREASDFLHHLREEHQ